MLLFFYYFYSKLIMSTKYKATEISQAYFITITTVGWVDVFTRLPQKHLIIDALKYCQKKIKDLLYLHIALCTAICIYFAEQMEI